MTGEINSKYQSLLGIQSVVRNLAQYCLDRNFSGCNVSLAENFIFVIFLYIFLADGRNFWLKLMFLLYSIFVLYCTGKYIVWLVLPSWHLSPPYPSLHLQVGLPAVSQVPCPDTHGAPLPVTHETVKQNKTIIVHNNCTLITYYCPMHGCCPTTSGIWKEF